MNIHWRYWRADVLIFSLSLLLLWFTNLFYSTNGFVHKVLENGTILYCYELNSLGSDADNALLLGYLLNVPLLINIAIPHFFKLKCTIVTLSTAFVLFVFWGASTAEMANIQATILKDQNIVLLLWMIILHSIIPTYCITMNRLKRNSVNTDSRSK